MNRNLIRNLGLLLAGAILVLADLALAHHRPDNTVLIGGAISRTGRFAEPAGRQYNAVLMWVDEVNAGGGLLGHKIKLVMLDDKSDKQTSIKLYEKLITEDQVDLLLAPYSSGITDAVANVTERYHHPIVAYGAASRVIWERGRKYIFKIAALAEDYQRGAVHMAKDLGIKRIAIIGEDSLFPRATRAGLEVWAKKLGMQVVVAENYATQKQGDYTALLQKIRAQRVEAIFSNSYFDDAAAQIRQLREMNYNVKMFASTVGPGLPRFAQELGPTAEYVLGFSQWEPKPKLGYPGMQAFIDTYKGRFNETPNYHAGQAYASMQIFEAAVKHANTFDREKVRDALATIKVNTITGEWSVDETGMNDKEGLTFQIQNGERVIVWPPDVAEAKAILPMPEWSKR
jgi:branched-chain amino acid transport system substrate-binding protein